MSIINVNINLSKSGAYVEFEEHGRPVKIPGRHARTLTVKALRKAAADARRSADSVGEVDLARFYRDRTARIESELAMMGA